MNKLPVVVPMSEMVVRNDLIGKQCSMHRTYNTTKWTHKTY